MAELGYSTDQWGGKKGSHYLEFKVNGNTIQIELDDDHVRVIGPAFVDTDARSCNAFSALVKGGRFQTMQQYYEYVDASIERRLEILRASENGEGGTT